MGKNVEPGGKKKNAPLKTWKDFDFKKNMGEKKVMATICLEAKWPAKRNQIQTFQSVSDLTALLRNGVRTSRRKVDRNRRMPQS